VAICLQTGWLEWVDLPRFAPQRYSQYDSWGHQRTGRYANQRSQNGFCVQTVHIISTEDLKAGAKKLDAFVDAEAENDACLMQKATIN
jgi:hypothetical protein